MAVKQWSPLFNPYEACFSIMIVWIRFSCLNVVYFEESVMKTIAFAIRKSIKVEFVTKSIKRGRYANVCMEIDLTLSCLFGLDQ